MINLKEVAKLSGTSQATVSRVLNDSGYVKQETKARVLESIKALDYRPLERSEGAKASKTIGLVVPNIENPFFGKVANHLSRAAISKNYNLLLYSLSGVEGNKDESLMELIESRVDCLIYASSYKNLELVNFAKSKKIPIVVLDREVTSAEISSVSVNNNYGAFLATEHLISLGHRNIAYFSAEQDMEISLKRREGYIRALEKYDIPVCKDYIYYGDYTMQSGFDCAEKMRARNPEITAMLAVNDLMAIGAINYFHKARVRVPEDISVVGFDNIEMSECVIPALTTVEYPIIKMSEVAIDLLLAQIKDKESGAETRTLFPKLIIRNSTGKARAIKMGGEK